MRFLMGEIHLWIYKIRLFMNVSGARGVPRKLVVTLLNHCCIQDW